MKENIYLYYNLSAENLKQIEENYEFCVRQDYFCLNLLKRSVEELKDIYQICEELKSKNIPIHTFIINRDGKIITQIQNQNYVLLKLETKLEKEFNIVDMIQFTNQIPLSKSKSNIYRNNWGELWSKKIDYFEYQIHELGKEKKLVLNSFSYYIGLAENAISYANNTNDKYKTTGLDKITLSRKRIDYPNFLKDYFNPLLFIFDLEVRDIAGYIKSAFFKNEEEAWIEVKACLSIQKWSIYGYQMFFARLLYPSYYFDIYEEIMNNQAKEEKLIKYIEKSKNYEIFLQKVYFEILKYAPIEKIDWLVEKKEL